MTIKYFLYHRTLILNVISALGSVFYTIKRMDNNKNHKKRISYKKTIRDLFYAISKAIHFFLIYLSCFTFNVKHITVANFLEQGYSFLELSLIQHFQVTKKTRFDYCTNGTNHYYCLTCQELTRQCYIFGWILAWFSFDKLLHHFIFH